MQPLMTTDHVLKLYKRVPGTSHASDKNPALNKIKIEIQRGKFLYYQVRTKSWEQMEE